MFWNTQEHRSNKGQSDKSNASVIFPMRVALISKGGTFCTMWLPDTMEGRYQFTPKEVGCRLPLYIEAEQNHWIAFAGRDGEFITEDGYTVAKALLKDQATLYYQCAGNKYVIYTELERPGDYEFLPYYLEDRSSYTIGRQDDCHICYTNECVSRQHATLQWKNGTWYINDENSTNGTYVNGKRAEHEELHNGDSIYIMGLYLLMGSGFVAINNLNNRVTINTPKIRRIQGESDVFYPPCPEQVAKGSLFERQPRKRYQPNRDSIAIDMPPVPMGANKIPLLLRLGSPLVMGGQSLLTGNYLMTLTSMVFPVLTQGLTEKERREYEAKRHTVYKAYLEEKEQEIYEEKRNEEKLLNINYPPLDMVLGFALNETRLWERRKNDEDFLNIRIGWGSYPLLAERTYSEKRFELERDPLAEAMYQLAERQILLDKAPVMLSLKNDYVVGIPGIPENAVPFIRNLMMQVVLTHSYDEVKIVLLLDTDLAQEFDFVRYLPHTWDDDQSIRFFVTSRSEASQLSEFLSRETESVLKESDKKTWLRKHPAYLIFALDKDLFDCVEILKELMFQEDYCGVSIVAAFEGVPKECTKLINLSETPRMVDLRDLEGKEQQFQLDECQLRPRAWESMRKLMRTKLMAGSQAYSLPNSLSFLEMFSVGRVEHLNPLKRWGDNNPVKSLAAPVGVGTDGSIFTLDLHEKYQGPHGLVAGMTGSGKSEFLITYILSMAVSYSPDEVAFILIDYKGGGLADAFENKDKGIHLPHIAGTITNLDGSSIQRSLMSIKSELRRRQEAFKRIKAEMNEGTLDIYDYQKLYRNKRVSEPMPHLFIISDEFAELKQQQPDFMEELISAARIGRSLGVHLILATQKPSGVVNDQIWSNTKFRVCLRVQDRGDSMEMLKRPEAAELKHTGRFYLQVGYNEYFALGQSAWCGADYVPQDEAPTEKDDSLQFVDNVGQTVLSVKPEATGKSTEFRQIVAIVQYLSELARREGISARPLWTEPLPVRLELETLLERYIDEAPSGISALIGMVDDPEKQRQFPLWLDFSAFYHMLLVGNAGSGKSTLLRTMLYTLVKRYSPDRLNYYIVDLSNGALGVYRYAPHCGAYLTEKNTADLPRLAQFIRGIIEQRKKLFMESQVTTFEAYQNVKPLPLILFVVDGFTNISNMGGGEDFYMGIQDFLRDGANTGVRFILSVNHMNEASTRARQELDYRIALQAKDSYEYADILDVRCKITAPEIEGRGICVADERPLVYHTAMLDCEADERRQSELLRERLEKLSAQSRGQYAAKLPMADVEEEYETFCRQFQPECIPLGYSRRDMKPVAIPLQQLHSMSLYFGNPQGILPVFRNLMKAAAGNHMDVIVVRRLSESIFDASLNNGILNDNTAHVTLLESTEEDLLRLKDLLFAEIPSRNELRDEYSRQQGIPLSSKGRAKRARRYIRAHSTPIMIVMERFGDFCLAGGGENEELIGMFNVFFKEMQGYNIYFAAGFYPDDDNAMSKFAWTSSFNTEQFLLLFGGRYDRVAMPPLSYEITKLDGMDPEYNRFLMKYKEAWYPMVMPCGKLDDGACEPDEAPIV